MQAGAHLEDEVRVKLIDAVEDIVQVGSAGLRCHHELEPCRTTHKAPSQRAPCAADGLTRRHGIRLFLLAASHPPVLVWKH
jgi:hypothetical protein